MARGEQAESAAGDAERAYHRDLVRRHAGAGEHANGWGEQPLQSWSQSVEHGRLILVPAVAVKGCQEPVRKGHFNPARGTRHRGSRVIAVQGLW